MVYIYKCGILASTLTQKGHTLDGTRPITSVGGEGIWGHIGQAVLSYYGTLIAVSDQYCTHSVVCDTHKEGIMVCGHELVPVSGMTTHGYISVTVEIWWVRHLHNPVPEVTMHYINGAWGERLNSLEKAVFFDLAEQRLMKKLILQLVAQPDQVKEVVGG